MIPRQPHILVHIERNDILEREFLFFHQPYEHFVRRNGTRASGKAKHEFLLGSGVEFVYPASNVVPNVLANGGWIVANDEAHFSKGE